ncbi:MAG: ABC transporter permease [Pseudodonghicola sp.]
MARSSFLRTALFTYLTLFFLWQIMPLLVSAGAAFNDTRFPGIVPWRGTTSRWFVDMWNDGRLWHSVWNTAWVALAVTAVSIPIGTAGAILLSNVAGRGRALLYGVMIAPFLTPEAVTGISTLVFWTGLGLPAGLHLSVLGQASGTATFVMLLVLARLQNFDPSLEEAALDLGASHAQVIRQILMPHILPAVIGSAVMSILLSIQNYNVTLFTRGNSETLMVYIGLLAKTGVTPKINALAFTMMSFAVIGAVGYEIWRRRQVRQAASEARSAKLAAASEN